MGHQGSLLELVSKRPFNFTGSITLSSNLMQNLKPKFKSLPCILGTSIHAEVDLPSTEFSSSLSLEPGPH